MPNIQTEELKLVEFPVSFGDYKFEFIVTSKRGEKLLYTTYKDKSFFLQIIKRESDFLIKCDKLTRISPVEIIQNGLKNFQKLHNLKVTFSNIERKTKKYQREKSIDIVKKASYFEKEFIYRDKIYIEIGFGSGRHLLYQAKRSPNSQFIGLEIHKPSIEQVAKQCEIQNIDNILISDFDARVFLQLLKSNSIDKIFVHFPIPWDKKPHRRIVSESFIDEAFRILKPNGKIELRTDSQNYFAYTLTTIQKLKRYSIEIRKNYDIDITSKYEDRWKNQNKNIYDLSIKNHEISKERTVIDELRFDREIDFNSIKKKFTKHTIKERDYFVHFEDIYEGDGNFGAIKLSLGAYEKCEHKYLLFKDNMVQYFPNVSLSIVQNYKSHKKIEEFLYV